MWTYVGRVFFFIILMVLLLMQALGSQSLSANQVIMRTQDAPIHASLSAMNKVELVTSNAEIVARVNLTDVPSGQDFTPSTATIRTSHGYVLL